MKAQLWWYEQIFQIEQFAQGADHLDSFFLVANGASPEVKNKRGQTPLSLATSKGNEAITRLLHGSNQAQ